MAKIAQKIPTTAKLAKKNKRYARLAVKHTSLEKKKWAMVKQSGKWQFVKAASAKVSGPHIVCYYDPNTGFYDDCHAA